MVFKFMPKKFYAVCRFFIFKIFDQDCLYIFPVKKLIKQNMIKIITFGNNRFMNRFILPMGNGVGLFLNNKLCVSIIDSNGDKKVNGRILKAQKSKFLDFPIVRGFVYFFKGLYLYFITYILQMQLEESGEDKNKSAKQAGKINFASGYILLIALFIIAFLFGLLVLGFLTSNVINLGFEFSDYYLKSFMVALFRVAVVYLFFLILRFMPFMQGLYSFNSAGGRLFNGKDNISQSRSYPLNFLNFLLNILLLSLFVVSLVAININFIANFFINAGIFLLCIPICYEYLRFATYSKQLWVKDITLVTNFLICVKPNITHEEVLMVAKNEIDNFEDFEKVGKDRIAMSALYAEMQTKLKASEKFEDSDMDWIIATVLGTNRVEMKLVRSVNAKQYREIMRACDRRAKGEPLSNIFGFVEFYGLKLDVNKKVLSPRMETELLVDEAIKKIREFELKTALDMCTGSGAIAIAIAKYTDCKVTGVDISKQALQVAQNNAIKNDVKVEFIQSDLFKGLKKRRKYDIIISNPPYIKSGDIEKLDVEVKKYDPRLALDGGEDGLEFYRKIIESLPKHLCKRGWVFFEVGIGQADAVRDLLQENNFENIQVIKDYNKIERIVYGRIGK